MNVTVRESSLANRHRPDDARQTSDDRGRADSAWDVAVRLLHAASV